MEELDTITKEARFAMMLGGKPSERRDSVRIFQFGTYKGRPAAFTRLYAHGQVEVEGRSKPKFSSEADFDATVLRYEVDDRWLRLA